MRSLAHPAFFLFVFNQTEHRAYLFWSAASGRCSQGLPKDSWTTWFQWLPFGKPTNNTVVPCSSATYQRVFRWKSQLNGTTPPWKQREKRLTITVSVQQGISYLFPNKFTFFLFPSFLLCSSHMLNGSDLVLHFCQPARACSISASSSTLPFPTSGEETRPAFSTPSLGRATKLGPAEVSYPEPWRPRSTGTDQWSDPGARGEGAPCPACWMSAVSCWHSTEGLIWSYNEYKHNFATLVLYNLSFISFADWCVICLTGHSQTHNAQSVAGSGGAKTKVDKHPAAKGSTALFTQVRSNFRIWLEVTWNVIVKPQFSENPDHLFCFSIQL